jgi:long-subunit acyl-CoA synthetase (AMP-forming)
LLENLTRVIEDPFGMIFSGSGLVFLGGLMGGTLGVTYVIRKNQLNWLTFGDIVAPLLILGYAIGRIGCFLVGDGKKYCSALFTLDVGAILRDKLGMDPNDIPKDPAAQNKKLEELGHALAEFTGGEETRVEVQAQVDELNKRFSNPEQLKKFAILPRDFSIDDDELTPTLKLKRRQISANWVDAIEKMYTE